MGPNSQGCDMTNDVFSQLREKQHRRQRSHKAESLKSKKTRSFKRNSIFNIVIFSSILLVRANDTNFKQKPVLRVFQGLPKEPAEMDSDEMMRTIRATQVMVFGSQSENESSWDGMSVALDIYSPSERREYLVKRGNKCHPANNKMNSGSGSFNSRDSNNNFDKEDHTFLQWFDVLSRYDSLLASAASSKSSLAHELERLATELWKFCVLYNGDGHVYLDYKGGMMLKPLKEILAKSLDENVGVIADDSLSSNVFGISSNKNKDKSEKDGRYIHESFLAISPYTPATSELSAIIRVILETTDEMLALSPLILPRELHRLIVGRASLDLNVNDSMGESKIRDGNNDDENGASWTLLKNTCVEMAESGGVSISSTNIKSSRSTIGIQSFFSDPSSSSTLSGLKMSTSDAHARRAAARCPLSEGGYCCLAFQPEGDESDPMTNTLHMPAIALRHPVGAWSILASRVSSSSHMVSELPFKLNPLGIDTDTSSKEPMKLGGVPMDDLHYISTVRLIKNDTEKILLSGTHSGDKLDTPNFFDILFENDCLPYRKECHRCLKDVSNESPNEKGQDASVNVGDIFGKHSLQNACAKCKLECPCYCDILCKVRPPPKIVVRTYAVYPPKYKKEVGRLVPKIVHQTWFEPVTKDKYPNMSRLIESWRKSGWEYYFYDDDTAGEFLSTHFPPEVHEAYQSIIPGAFKADLFRYCVLLIRGGVYADMDVILETNLDDAIADDIGFMTPIDEPGFDVGHRSCLWNGLIASAPGHPFLARTIEIVVNNIRNRFTAVDYDDMLCPNPVLSISHTVDTLFTCGPCILGAGINNIIGRHMQSEFEIGDVDVWQNERMEMKKNNPKASGDIVSVRPDDPRLLIPGRTVILKQDKNDMGAHRFTWSDRQLIIAATDMPDYDDRPATKEHYSKTHEKAGIYGMRKLYTDNKRANEEIRIFVEKS